MKRKKIKSKPTKVKKKISFLRKHFTLITAFAILFLFISGNLAYKYYLTYYYDSSTSKAELQDLNPPSPPPDITKKIKGVETKQVQNLKEQLSSVSATYTIQVPILMYHYVEYVKDPNDKVRLSLNTTPYILEEEVKTLINGGYTFITNKQLADAIDGKAVLPTSPIMLTFDDGYADFYTDAYPILKRYNAKATEYVISGFLNRQNHLSTAQLREIASDGLVEIGAHTVNHVWLKGSSLQNEVYEVSQSKSTLESLTNIPVVSFAYPFGAFDNQTAKVVENSGFKSAVSTLPGVDINNDNRFFLFRLRPGGRTGQTLLNWLHQMDFAAF